MLIYNKKTKYNLYLSNSLNLGEDEMKYYEGITEVDFKLFEISSIIDNSVKNIKNYYTQNNEDNKLSSEIEFLEKWIKFEKEKLFKNINTTYISLLSFKIEESLKKRIDAYIKHIKLMESKEDCLYKYEKLYNLIIQIPAKINYFIESEIRIDSKEIKTSQVKQNITITPDNKKTSPRKEMSFYYGDKWSIDYLAA